MLKIVGITIIIIFFSQEALAEPKQLVCRTSVEYGVEWYSDMGDGEDVSKWREHCESGEAEYGFQVIYTLDTAGLSNSTMSNAEEQTTLGCGLLPLDVVSVTMSATPSIITFKGKFNVDRKTLMAGYRAERPYTCKLQDVDTSENIL